MKKLVSFLFVFVVFFIFSTDFSHAQVFSCKSGELISSDGNSCVKSCPSGEVSFKNVDGVLACSKPLSKEQQTAWDATTKAYDSASPKGGISRAQFDTLVNNVYNNDVIYLIDLTDPKFSPKARSVLKDKLYTRADSIFVSFGAKETTTEASMRSLIATSWADEIDAIRAGNDFTFFGKNNLMENLAVVLREKYKAAAVTVAVQAGKMTQAEAAQARKDGAVSTNAQLRAIAEKKASECKLFPINMGACISDFFTWVIKAWLVNIAGFFLWLTSNMFGYVMNIGVLNFKDWATPALYPMWTLVRQIVSLGVVFIGLYLGFMYIIGREDKFEKYIPWVLVFALFVNFSYPIARFAVDVSNVVTLNIYTASFGSDVFNDSRKSTVGAIVLEKLGLTQLVMAAVAVPGKDTPDLLSQVNSVPGALLTVIFVGYAGYVFFMATVLIATRTALLVMLIVASPILLIDSVIPVLGDRAQKIRKIFFEQLAVGPVFIILMAMVLKFMTIFSGKGPLGNATDAAMAGGSKDIAVFFNILMMLIMLHFTLKITKSVAGELGQMATNAMGKVGGFAAGAGVGAATAGAGLLARNTIGKAAMKLRDNKWVTNNQDSFLGRRVYDMSNSMAKSSFDLRNSSVIAGGMSRVGMTGVGKGRTAGYEEAMEARKKDILARGARIKTRYERDVYEDEKDEQGNVIMQDVDMPDGTKVKKPKQKIVHRKGDVNVDAERALDRYTARGGGALFMAKDVLNGDENKKGVKELLGEQADAESKKRIDEAKEKSTKDAEMYKSITDDPQNEDGMGFKKKDRQMRYKSMLEGELKELDKTDPERRGQQSQSLVQSLKAIAESDKAEKAAFDKQVESHLYQYQNMYGKSTDEIEANRQKFLLKLSKEEKAAVEGRINGGTGDAFRTRQERVQAVASGRKVQKDDFETELETRKQTGDVYTDNKKAGIEQINRKYADELKKLESSSSQSSIIDPATGKPFSSEPSQADIEAIERKKEEEIANYEAFLRKKKIVAESPARLVKFARGVGVRTPSATNLDLDLDVPADPTPEVPIAEKNWDNYELPPSMRGGGSVARSSSEIQNERIRRQEAATAAARSAMTSATVDIDVTANVPDTHNPLTDNAAATIAQLLRGQPSVPLLTYNPTPGASADNKDNGSLDSASAEEAASAIKKAQYGSSTKPEEAETA